MARTSLWYSILGIQKSCMCWLSVTLNPRRIRNDEKVVTQRAEQRTHEKRGIKCVGKALTRRSSIQELQGMRMTDDISTTRSSRYWLQETIGITRFFLVIKSQGNETSFEKHTCSDAGDDGLDRSQNSEETRSVLSPPGNERSRPHRERT